MRKLTIAACVLLLALPLLAGSGAAQREGQLKAVSGQVTGASGQPLKDAVVYLKNTRTLAVKSFIADAGGNYRFHALAPNTDYELYAEFNGQKSDTKTVSAFDTRTNLTINLKIDVK